MSYRTRLSPEVLIARFKRRGSQGNTTYLWPPADEAIRNFVLRAVSLVPDETPIFLVFLSKGEWLLITSRRVIGYPDNGDFFTFDHEAIKDAQIDVDLNTKHGFSNMQDFEFLRIDTDAGKHSSFRIEAGYPFIGIWNVLHAIATRNSAGG